MPTQSPTVELTHAAAMALIENAPVRIAALESRIAKLESLCREQHEAIKKLKRCTHGGHGLHSCKQCTNRIDSAIAAFEAANV